VSEISETAERRILAALQDQTFSAAGLSEAIGAIVGQAHPPTFQKLDGFGPTTSSLTVLGGRPQLRAILSPAELVFMFGVGAFLRFDAWI
jgi:hypothetical protein